MQFYILNTMMKLWCFTIICLGLIGLKECQPLDDSEDSDSSEHGVVVKQVHNNCTCGNANKGVTKIVNGKATGKNEFPLVVGLVYRKIDLIQCGGTILTSRHILTAAHCTEPYKPSDYGIFVGHNSYAQAKYKIKLLRPKKFYNHYLYNEFYLTYDIAIILMKDHIKLSDTIGPACLPTNEINLLGEKVTLLGWGKKSYGGKVSEVLLKVKVYIVETSECYVHEDFKKDDLHQLCTFRKYKDSCSGDSGGPVLWLDPDTNRYTVVGVTSYSRGCAKEPAVNSDIFYFIPWIQGIISETDPSLKTCSKV